MDVDGDVDIIIDSYPMLCHLSVPCFVRMCAVEAGITPDRKQLRGDVR